MGQSQLILLNYVMKYYVCFFFFIGSDLASISNEQPAMRKSPLFSGRWCGVIVDDRDRWIHNLEVVEVEHRVRHAAVRDLVNGTLPCLDRTPQSR